MAKKNNNMTNLFLFSLLFGGSSFAVYSEENINYIPQEQPENDSDQDNDCVKPLLLELTPLKNVIEEFKQYVIPVYLHGYDTTNKIVNTLIDIQIKNKMTQHRQESDAILCTEGDTPQQPPHEMIALKNGVIRAGYFLAKTFKDDVIPVCQHNYDKAKKCIDQYNEQRERMQTRYRQEADLMIRKKTESTCRAHALKTVLDKDDLDNNECDVSKVRPLTVTMLNSQVLMIKIGVAGVFFAGLSCALYKLYATYFKSNNKTIVDEQVE